MMTRSEKSRQIVERIVVEGTLKLLTPTSLSNGDADGLTDISLIKDEFSGNALLTGTSICGALRNYLRECSLDFEQTEESQYKDNNGRRLKQKDSTGKSINIPLPLIAKLFGNIEDDGSQSLLIIDDAVSSEKPKTELRDGVRIDGKTRTAYVDEHGKGSKFDLELLEAGIEFPLRFELLICEQRRNKEETAEEVKANTDKFKQELVTALATALLGFELGEINLGGRKRRGYGECKVGGWKVKTYKLTEENGKHLLDWLRNNNNPLNGISEKPILNALDVSPNADIRNYFELNAWFAIDGSILIRSGSKFSDKYQPDSVHLRSNGKPIISGTSLAGVLRHRAFKIINTLSDKTIAQTFTEKMFGDDDTKKKDKSASRLEVSETVIKNTNDLVHTRVKIDRFTGGAFDSALFDAAPVFSDGEQNAVNLKLRLRNAQPCEIGLILLLLKDLWTSDLAIGGESSIGRGRLKGKTASLRRRENGTSEFNISFDQTLSLSESDRNQLNGFVTQLNSTLNQGAMQSNGTEN